VDGLPAWPGDPERGAGGNGVAALVPLERSFFGRPTAEVARDLLGTLVVREVDGAVVVGRIVETEAYGGPEDRASHSRAGLTTRTAPMHGPVGHAYVYLVYGMHHCLNVVAREDGAAAGAVLVRALEPLDGLASMRDRRGRTRDPDDRLCSGPARLTQALAIDRRLDGLDLTKAGELWLAAGEGPRESDPVASGPRVGVGYAGADWAGRPWRFWLAGNRSVSR
jgi:DNA-3-methyladenine glycosylase